MQERTKKNSECVNESEGKRERRVKDTFVVVVCVCVCIDSYTCMM